MQCLSGNWLAKVLYSFKVQNGVERLPQQNNKHVVLFIWPITSERIHI